MSNLTKEERNAIRIGVSANQFLATMMRLQMIKDIRKKDKSLSWLQGAKKLMEEIQTVEQAFGELNENDPEYQARKKQIQEQAQRERNNEAVSKTRDFYIPASGLKVR